VINRLIELVILVVVVALIAWFLSWAMAALGVPGFLVTVIWVAFGLLVLIAVVGMLGYGPFRGSWRSP
jgi:hypothetical protein